MSTHMVFWRIKKHIGTFQLKKYLIWSYDPSVCKWTMKAQILDFIVYISDK